MPNQLELPQYVRKYKTNEIDKVPFFMMQTALVPVYTLKVSTNFLKTVFTTKFNNRSIRKNCEICSKLTIKTPERRKRRFLRAFYVSFEHTSHIFCY